MFICLLFISAFLESCILYSLSTTSYFFEASEVSIMFLFFFFCFFFVFLVFTFINGRGIGQEEQGPSTFKLFGTGIRV